jgi:hypothetical protein
VLRRHGSGSRGGVRVVESNQFLSSEMGTKRTPEEVWVAYDEVNLFVLQPPATDFVVCDFGEISPDVRTNARPARTPP